MKQHQATLKKLVRGLLLALSLSTLVAATAQAAIIIDFPVSVGYPLIVAADGDVTLTYQGGASALFVNELYLDSPQVLGPIFNNSTSTVGQTFTITGLTAGDELLFRMSTSNGDDFYSGPAARNPDSTIHAQVGACTTPADCVTARAQILALLGVQLGINDTAYVGFEDQFGGGDLDYNDLRFTATNLVVPLPGALWLLGSGLAGLVGLRSRRKLNG